MITIGDYGLGNIKPSQISIKAWAPFIARDPIELSRASYSAGVGAFDWAMQRLESCGFRPILDDLVLNQSVPVLGICVGMR